MTSAVHPSFSSLTLVKALPPPPTGPMTAIPAPINIVPTNGIQAQIASSLCEHCKVQPKYFDGTKFHPFCGKTCALSARILASSSATTNSPQAGNHVPQTHQAQKSLCVVCQIQPQFNDGTNSFPYCGRTCAAKAAKQRRGTGSSNKQVTTTSTGPLCTIPGCQKQAYVDPTAGPTKFCGKAHRRLSMEACLVCKKAPKKVSHFCSRSCAQAAQQNAPGLLEVPEDHVTFRSVADQFAASWRHTNKKCPTVRRVYKIVGSQASLDKYEAYRDKVESQGQFKASGRSPGNENRRWHGTRRECTLGDNGHAQFCSSTTCSLCCIVKSTYDLSFFKKRTNWGRFGARIYTSSTSSKSDDYSDNVQQSNLKAILLNKVIVGKGCKMTHDSTTLTAPPAGYDSVLAEKGGSLNYDELVVYTNDAIRPSFLVLYDA